MRASYTFGRDWDYLWDWYILVKNGGFYENYD